ncbi:hypothetical protein BT96DRAFT_114262 [Gymnopus androsaceus JB14]|uniref:Uncharacterized protein n=1 Tax=Gymnopus androsaceus JB14 TaxID=1447944 RepID=A0A6A4HGI7_9AGAR|nr:hypothetical protein BT96DRAFT_114262 [Gymnopus androsaceus JB14]
MSAIAKQLYPVVWVTISLRQWIVSVFMKSGLLLLIEVIRNAYGGVSRALLYLGENHS